MASLDFKTFFEQIEYIYIDTRYIYMYVNIYIYIYICIYISLMITKDIYITKDCFLKLQHSAQLEEQYKNDSLRNN